MEVVAINLRRRCALPSIYLEHDPPRPYPVDTVHCFRHDRGILVHVTHYNALNWDAGGMPARVVEHGVPVDPSIGYNGELASGITVINACQKEAGAWAPTCSNGRASGCR